MNRRKLTGKSALILIIILVIYAFFNMQKDEAKKVYISDGTTANVHFVDVGQADCAIIQSPYGNILIDAGTYDGVDDTVEYIDSLGVTEFEYAVFTHPHTDHIGGASVLLETYDFKRVIMPDAVSTSYSFEKMINSIEKEDCEVIEGTAGKKFKLGEDCMMELIAPVKDYSADEDELNNTSIVTRFTFGDVSFLFTGDAERASEIDMLDNDLKGLDADVLKVGHHGSSTSSSWNFLQAVSPDIAVVSAGKDNEYGHPHREVVDRFDDMEIEMYITYEVGSVVVTTDGVTYKVNTEK